MSTDTTMGHTGWEDPLPEHDGAHTEQAGAAAAVAHDWDTSTDWDAPAAEATQPTSGPEAGVKANAVNTANTDAEKAKSKRKANLLIAGIAVALVGVVGTGLAVKNSRSKGGAEDYPTEPMIKSSSAAQATQKQPSAAPIAAQPAAPQPDVQPSADLMSPKSDLSPSPAGSIAQAPTAVPVATQSDTVAPMPTDSTALRDLKAKSSAQEAANVELKGQLAALAERVAALESKGQAAAGADRHAEVSRSQNVVHVGRAKQKLAYDMDVVRGKPGAAGAVGAEPERTSNWSAYHTVATYPATGKAEKAWVTNGKGLVVVTVGSEIDGVKVSRLVGTTVFLADGGKINVK
ncbi:MULTISPECIES: hypothetical protein [unclassified Cupriavidus]|uniref:hypothetical protein n=1 Tax=unclassified Cupriavidus TaxID=2640874 RepID=UPI00313DD3F2